MAERLGLSAEQQSQLTIVLQEQRTRYEELRAQIEPVLVELRKETAARISELLTEEQQEEFQQLRAGEPENMKHRSRAESHTASEEPEGDAREKAP